MKRAFKNIVLFLSAIILLAGCSNDEEGDGTGSLGIVRLEMSKIAGTTQTKNIYHTWVMSGYGQDDGYSISSFKDNYKITLFEDGTFECTTTNNIFRGKYTSNEDGTFKFTDYSGVDLTVGEDEPLIHTNMKKVRRFGVNEQSFYLALYYTDKDFYLFWNCDDQEN